MEHRTGHLLHYYCQISGFNCWLSYFVFQSQDQLDCLKISPQASHANAWTVPQLITQSLPSTVFPVHYLLFILSNDACAVRPVDNIFPYKQNIILLFLHLVNLIQMYTSQ